MPCGSFSARLALARRGAWWSREGEGGVYDQKRRRGGLVGLVWIGKGGIGLRCRSAATLPKCALCVGRELGRERCYGLKHAPDLILVSHHDYLFVSSGVFQWAQLIRVMRGKIGK